MRKRVLKFLAGVMIFGVTIGFSLLILHFVLGPSPTGSEGSHGVIAGLLGVFASAILGAVVWLFTGRGVNDLMDWMER